MLDERSKQEKGLELLIKFYEDVQNHYFKYFKDSAGFHNSEEVNLAGEVFDANRKIHDYKYKMMKELYAKVPSKT